MTEGQVYPRETERAKEILLSKAFDNERLGLEGRRTGVQTGKSRTIVASTDPSVAGNQAQGRQAW